MRFLDIKTLVKSTLRQMEERGVLKDDEPSAAGFKSSVVRMIAELEVAKHERAAGTGLLAIGAPSEPRVEDDECEFETAA